MAKQLIDVVGSFSRVVNAAYTQGSLTIDAYANMVENIGYQLRSALDLYGFAVQAGSQKSKTLSVDTDAGKDFEINPAVVTPVVDKRSFIFTGLNTYTVTETDTLQGLAQKYLGDDNMWVFIASVNPDITSNYDLVVGTDIYIPVLYTGDGDTKDSFILTEDTSRNPYGSDILIDADGNMVLTG
jgi:hypothetical protein